ncbi:hypothetical protein SERLA73DRAFT_74732 [Serpula lacrymans var. lacrymans S7.3]|uniref:HTH CENPB-type domain-containing protein n=2 Tax=Serpula lacrymans var. lacrymans TaxID=341189 RepID=F8Q059_SERL3|nr:uncharacterized protein SERLADRAFT_439407 [Serpula lacrymans var. lacrymans S7.9]EGN98531.1 hypothetical protein SERLA73DRAFT_74732 [Serpula lacrymans var. lacrymans S7.3]EGO24100.1 hypothetical protein SERLADRAFT_439407 [Serpula lacrymans var. lacrymans S7.9]
MPPIWTRRHRHHALTSQQPPASDVVDLEEQIQATCKATSTGAVKNLKAACRDLEILRHYYTALRRYNGKALPSREAHIQQQHLSQAQEGVLLEYIEFLGNTGHPLCKQTVAPYIYNLCSKYPSEKWIRCFLKRNEAQIAARWSSTLDPMRAQALNFPVV